MGRARGVVWCLSSADVMQRRGHMALLLSWLGTSDSAMWVAPCGSARSTMSARDTTSGHRDGRAGSFGVEAAIW